MQVVRATPVAAIKSGASPQALGAASSTGGNTTFVLTPAINQQIVKQVKSNVKEVNKSKPAEANTLPTKPVLSANGQLTVRK